MNPAPAFAEVYAELRRIAAARLASEAPGQTLDATALVHEAYLRIVNAKPQAAQNYPRAFNFTLGSLATFTHT